MMDDFFGIVFVAFAILTTIAGLVTAVVGPPMFLWWFFFGGAA